jgi:hypothetical protein
MDLYQLHMVSSAFVVSIKRYRKSRDETIEGRVESRAKCREQIEIIVHQAHHHRQISPSSLFVRDTFVMSSGYPSLLDANELAHPPTGACRKLLSCSKHNKILQNHNIKHHKFSTKLRSSLLPHR